MTTEEVRDLLYDALAIFRHQRHAGSERIADLDYRDDGLLINFDDGSLVAVTIIVTPGEEEQ